MKKEYIFGLLICFFGIIFVVLIMNNLYTYCIVVGTVIVVLGSLLGIELYSKNNKGIEAFRKKVNSIIKKYDAILVQSNIPNLKGLNIIFVNSIEDMVDAQVEIRKPIFYKKQYESCSFILLDQNNALIHNLKLNDDVISPLEIILKELEKAKKKEDFDYSILKDIEKTTIIKLENSKSYKVSPVRKTSNDEEIEII